ncbi:predicted protein [Naegleria gruberi]|uniref:Predicted protein n=1 Tax=Naegleria gruberi TaxID=5762 RepID=D2V806_NAEGR|nr:uncharacterized protein NAEGRDRAFT_64985 [Naegleria gruberi]EFC46959.1 predicted protein [Naegleria gruberi]|eukprot:XP_002679703.1 predicted protein [Naegleria gruberi strain NEG-M]
MSQYNQSFTTQPGYPQPVNVQPLSYNPAIQQFSQPQYGQPMSPSLQPSPSTPNSSFTKQSGGSFHMQQDPALIQSNTPSQPVLECKNLLPFIVNDKLVKNTFWATGGNILIKIFIFVVNKFILMGLGEALMVNYITRREVKNMRIGNRMLSYKSRGNFKMALLCVVNWILNIFSCGLFYILGYSHIMYLSQLDARIHWGKPAKISKKSQ